MDKSKNSGSALTPGVAGQTWQEMFPAFQNVYNSDDDFSLTDLADALSDDMQNKHTAASRADVAEAFLEAVKTDKDFEYFKELVGKDVETDGQSNFVEYKVRGKKSQYITYADLRKACEPQEKVTSTSSATNDAGNANWGFRWGSSSSAQNLSNSAATSAATSVKSATPNSVEIPQPVLVPKREAASARIEKVMLDGKPVYAVVAGVDGGEKQYVFDHASLCLGLYTPARMLGYSATVDRREMVNIDQTRADDYLTPENQAALHAKNLGLLKVGVFSNQTPEGKHSVSAISYNGKWYNITGNPYNTTSQLPPVVKAALASQEDSFEAQMKAANLKLLSVTTVSYEQDGVEVTVPAIGYNGAFYDENGVRISGKGIPNLPLDVLAVAQADKEGIQAKLAEEYLKLISEYIEKSDMSDEDKADILAACLKKNPEDMLEQLKGRIERYNSDRYEEDEKTIRKPLENLDKSPEAAARASIIEILRQFGDKGVIDHQVAMHKRKYQPKDKNLKKRYNQALDFYVQEIKSKKMIVDSTFRDDTLKNAIIYDVVKDNSDWNHTSAFLSIYDQLAQADIKAQHIWPDLVVSVTVPHSDNIGETMQLYEDIDELKPEAREGEDAYTLSSFDDDQQPDDDPTSSSTSAHYINHSAEARVQGLKELIERRSESEEGRASLKRDVAELDAQIKRVFETYASVIDQAMGFKGKNSILSQRLYEEMSTKIRQLVNKRDFIVANVSSKYIPNPSEEFKFAGMSAYSLAGVGTFTIPASNSVGQIKLGKDGNQLFKPWDKPQTTFANIKHMIFKALLNMLRYFSYTHRTRLSQHQKRDVQHQRVVKFSDKVKDLPQQQDQLPNARSLLKQKFAEEYDKKLKK